jgi:nascent polypeptide-associated complex subunit alpha
LAGVWPISPNLKIINLKREKKAMSDGDNNNITEDFTPEPIPENETPEQAARRISKGEKKFKRAMGKMGMKSVDGITRVTLKTNKNFILYIDAPEVMKAPGAEESYIVFGEAKFLDFSKNNAAS